MEVQLTSIDQEVPPPNESHLILKTGEMVMVPPFNWYQLKNIGERDLDLYLFYGREEKPGQKVEEMKKLQGS